MKRSTLRGAQKSSSQWAPALIASLKKRMAAWRITQPSHAKTKEYHGTVGGGISGHNQHKPFQKAFARELRFCNFALFVPLHCVGLGFFCRMMAVFNGSESIRILKRRIATGGWCCGLVLPNRFLCRKAKIFVLKFTHFFWSSDLPIFILFKHIVWFIQGETHFLIL